MIIIIAIIIIIIIVSIDSCLASSLRITAACSLLLSSLPTVLR